MILLLIADDAAADAMPPYASDAHYYLRDITLIALRVHMLLLR